MSKINLLPWREDLKKIKNRIFVAILGVSVCFSVVIIILVGAYYDSELSKQNANIAYIDKEMVAIRSEINEFKDVQNTKDQILNRMNIIQELRADRISVVKLLDVLPRVVPDTVYLKKFSRTLVDVPPPPPNAENADKTKSAAKASTVEKEAEPGGTETPNVRTYYHVYLEGVAEANEGISMLLKNLEKTPWIVSVKLNEVSINHEGKGLDFKLSMTQYLSEREGE